MLYIAAYQTSDQSGGLVQTIVKIHRLLSYLQKAFESDSLVDINK